MFFLLISILVLALLVGLITYLKRKNISTPLPPVVEVDDECCGAHEVCERDSLYAINPEVVYYDDEELDELANISPIDFTMDQLERLEHVFYTLPEKDVAGWLRSVQLRNIQLPIDLREEALLIVSERRSK